jgi:UDP-glucose 4-epimerase
MNYLLLGGAGYIGSHVARDLVRAGQDITILDDLSKGHRDAVRGFELVVGESVEQPLAYYDNNVGKTTRLLTAMKEKGVTKFVLSSSPGARVPP